MADRNQVLSELRRSGTLVIDSLRDMAEEEFESGRYENGWNARQILAHIASVEWTYPKLLAVASAPAQPDGSSEAPQARGGFDAYNARQVERRASATALELLDEFKRNRTATIEAVREADPSIFDAEIRSAGGARGALADVLLQVAVSHVEEHLRDIVTAHR